MFLPWTMTLGQWLFEQQIKLKEKKKTGKGRTEERGGVVSIKDHDESHFRG